MNSRITSALALAAAALAAAGPASAGASNAASSGVSNATAPRPAATVSAGVFSPNGDGFKDLGTIRFTLPRGADDVELTISRAGRYAGPLRTVRLGFLRKGSHVWSWDGRADTGRRLGDGSYRITVSGGSFAPGSERIVADTAFSPHLAVTPSPADPDTQNPAVYPRSTAVRDVLHLRTMHSDRHVRRLTMTIRDPRGRVVLRRVERGAGAGDTAIFVQRWAARAAGKALPPGRYRAVLSGTDRMGNHGSDTQAIWVSRESLEWQDEVRELTAASTRRDVCEFSSANGCGDPPHPCGDVVASEMYAGGLSYRSAECATGPAYHHAAAAHFLPVPEASVRGIEEAKVSFVGRPTGAGERDQGTLLLGTDHPLQHGASVTGTTGGETPWVRHPRGHQAWQDAWGDVIPAGVRWGFRTTGTDWVDVEKFTVSLRYLGVAD